MSTDPFEDAAETKKGVVRPLRKKTLGGAPYRRALGIEAKLAEVLALPADELVERCAVQDREDPAYIPSECLLYLVRTWEADDQHFETLYKLLLGRVLRALPTGESADGRTLSIPKARASEKHRDHFVDLLAKDRTSYAERLDFFEIRFNAGLATMRQDARRSACREPDHSPIEIDPSTGELSPEAEKAAGSFDPFDPAALDRADYRSRLGEAIKSLPIEQRTIMEMQLQNVPIDSKDPGAMTIAKTLRKSEKTVRLDRKS